MIVRVHRNYKFPDFYRQSRGNKGIWKDIQFTTDPIEKCDYFIALNPPNQPISVNVPKGNKWLFLQEPPVPEYQWHCQSFKYFDQVFGFWNDAKFQNIRSTQTCLPWHIHKSYDELVNLQLEKKEDHISWITSNQNTRLGHQAVSYTHLTLPTTPYV